MLAVKYYEETAEALHHYYVIYSFPENSTYPIWYDKYVSDWANDLTVDELRKATGNPSISGIIHTDVSASYIQEYEIRMIENLDYYKFVDEESNKGKSFKQIDAEWIKQQKMNDIIKSAKEYTAC